MSLENHEKIDPSAQGKAVLIEKKISSQLNPLLSLDDNALKKSLCPGLISPAAWNFTGSELREAIEGNRLLNVSFDPALTCNLNCPYCYTAKGKSREKDNNALTFKDYKRLILELKKAGTRTINIIGEGEPTLYPDLEKLLRFISENGIQICLVSNGIILASNDRLLDLLKELDVTICLKLNSFNGTIQDPLVGMRGYTTLRNKALEKIIEKGFNKGVPTHIAVNTLLLKPIYEEFNDIFKYCRENNIALISSLYIPNGRTEGGEFKGKEVINSYTSEDLFQPLTREEIGNLMNMIERYDKEHGIIRSPNPAYISGIPCTQALGFQIDKEGNIRHCPSRKLIKKGEVIKEKVSQLNVRQLDAEGLLKLWRNSGIPEIYTGRCLYKGEINTFK